MGRLIIEGDDAQLAIIAKRNKVRATRHGLKISIEDKVEPKPKKQTRKKAEK